MLTSNSLLPVQLSGLESAAAPAYAEKSAELCCDGSLWGCMASAGHCQEHFPLGKCRVLEAESQPAGNVIPLHAALRGEICSKVLSETSETSLWKALYSNNSNWLMGHGLQEKLVGVALFKTFVQDRQTVSVCDSGTVAPHPHKTT
jgi:hypothetical protein